MNELEREYRDKVFSYFNQYSADAIKAMRSILASKFEDDVVSLHFAMFPYDHFSEDSD